MHDISAQQVQSNNAKPVLALAGINKQFGDIEVLRDISLSMQAGDFLVLLGPSGCGKSTLLNCIAGIETVTAGKVFIGDKDMTQVPPRQRDIAMVFQSYALYPTMTVAENITFGMRVRGVDKSRQKQKLDSVASMLKIENLLPRKPSALSGGQRQRVAMGRALVRDPLLFLFDEPLSNLDAKLRVEMRAEIRALHESVDASIVYVTHDQVEAMTLATQLAVLNDGVLQQIDTPHQVYQAPANTFVARFMGSPPMNLLNLQWELDKFPHWRLNRNTGDDQNSDMGIVRMPVPHACLNSVSDVRQATVVGIRPEALTLGQKDAALNFRDLKVTALENTGGDLFATFAVGNQPMIARLDAARQLSVGDRCDLHTPLEALCYFNAESGQALPRGTA